MKKPKAKAAKVKVNKAAPETNNATGDKADKPTKVLHAMNKRHAVVSYSGKFRVVTTLPEPEYPLQFTCEFSTKVDFLNLNVHPKVPVKIETDDTIETVWIGRGKFFLDHPDHMHFDGIDFKPGLPAMISRTDRTGRATRYLNMYAGFSVEPQPGDCELYLQHIHDNVCGGQKQVYEYVLDWMASGVQHPENPGRIAISLRGAPGVGKGIFVTEYGMLFGRHFLHLTNAEQITGRFNAISAESLLIFADEAMFFGDKKASQVLKTLVSEKTKILERKGIDSIQIPSYARLIFATNDEHPLRIETKDRRYLALYVGNKHVKDRPYFQAIIDQMNNSGRAALLDLLLKRDISDFNAEAVPEGEEILKQKLASAPAGDRVIISFAQDGCLPSGDDDFNDVSRPWIARSRGPGFLFDEMRRRGGPDMRYLDEVALTDILKGWGFTRHAMSDQRAWAAPPLQDLREKLTAKYPAIVWDHLLAQWGDSIDTSKQDKERARKERSPPPPRSRPRHL
jgi:hypothetical protein